MNTQKWALHHQHYWWDFPNYQALPIFKQGLLPFQLPQAKPSTNQFEGTKLREPSIGPTITKLYQSLFCLICKLGTQNCNPVSGFACNCTWKRSYIHILDKLMGLKCWWRASKRNWKCFQLNLGMCVHDFFSIFKPFTTMSKGFSYQFNQMLLYVH